MLSFFIRFALVLVSLHSNRILTKINVCIVHIHLTIIMEENNDDS